MSFRPPMPDPDWARTLVHTDQKTRPVGDPTMWGNTVMTLIDDDPVLGDSPRVIDGGQILLAQAADKYSRSWSLTGSLAVRGVGWRFMDGEVPASGTASLPAEGLSVFLSVLQGIGQTTIEHQICLACNGFPTNIGLCWNQSAINGGPYVPMYTPTPIDTESFIVLPFACVGAFIGNSIAVRGIYLRGDVPGTAIPRAALSCILTPYAPGAGL